MIKSNTVETSSIKLNNLKATYSLVTGWNKYEIYVYYKGLASTELTANNIGIWISPNPMALSSENYKVRATEENQTLVSKFKLENSIPICNNNYWALDSNYIYLKYNVEDILSINEFDGKNEPEPIKLAITYKTKPTSNIALNNFKLKFELTRQENVDITPKILSYNLLLD